MQWLFSKIKKGFGISFWCTFSAWLSHANAPYLILYQLTKFQRHMKITFSQVLPSEVDPESLQHL